MKTMRVCHLLVKTIGMHAIMLQSSSYPGALMYVYITRFVAGA